MRDLSCEKADVPIETPRILERLPTDTMLGMKTSTLVSLSALGLLFGFEFCVITLAGASR